MAASRQGSGTKGGSVGADELAAGFRTSRSGAAMARHSVARPRNLTTFRQFSGTSAVSGDPLGGGSRKSELHFVSKFRARFKADRRVGRKIP